LPVQAAWTARWQPRGQLRLAPRDQLSPRMGDVRVPRREFSVELAGEPNEAWARRRYLPPRCECGFPDAWPATSSSTRRSLSAPERRLEREALRHRPSPYRLFERGIQPIQGSWSARPEGQRWRFVPHGRNDALCGYPHLSPMPTYQHEVTRKGKTGRLPPGPAHLSSPSASLMGERSFQCPRRTKGNGQRRGQALAVRKGETKSRPGHSPYDAALVSPNPPSRGEPGRTLEALSVVPTASRSRAEQKERVGAHIRPAPFCCTTS
jgi:hypothetical protein